jgi:hypothetical protein
MSTFASLRTARSEYVMTVRPACNYHTRARDVAGCVETRALTGGAVIVGMAVSGAASPPGRLVPARRSIRGRRLLHVVLRLSEFTGSGGAGAARGVG